MSVAQEFTAGLYLVAYLEGARRPELNGPLLERHEQYVDRWGQHLRWWAVDTGRGGRIVKLPADARDRPRARFEKLYGAPGWENDDSTSWMVHGGEDNSTATPWLAYGKLSAYESESRIHVGWAIPEWRGNWAGLVELAKAWFGGLPVLQGYGGLVFSELPAIEAGRELMLAARRYPGVDIDRPMLAEHVVGGLRPPAWLTVLGGRYREQAPRATLERLGGGIVLHELPNALMIQAGPRPEAGDPAHPERLQPLVHVAEALKPLRYTGRVVWWNIPDGNDWYQRFDRGVLP